MAGYQIKVTMELTKPPVWRRLVIPEKTTFSGLHDILQEAGIQADEKEVEVMHEKYQQAFGPIGWGLSAGTVSEREISGRGDYREVSCGYFWRRKLRSLGSGIPGNCRVNGGICLKRY